MFWFSNRLWRVKCRACMADSWVQFDSVGGCVWCTCVRVWGLSGWVDQLIKRPLMGLINFFKSGENKMFFVWPQLWTVLLYTTQLWYKYRKSNVQRLKVACNDAMLLMGVPRYHSASQLFADCMVPPLGAIIANIMYTFLCQHRRSLSLLFEAEGPLAQEFICECCL